jgi:DNA (cytosine-5)-methyltransferase 1
MNMSEPIVFGSVCSGIEAASVAWDDLGWSAAWLAEIEANPSRILAHHYPNVPNLGDMRLIPRLLRGGEIYPPDVFCGGTPCQAFSLAGLRNSLDDARGNLSLTFCEIANEIDIQRAANGLLPCVVKWENVPGVLSTHDNAFGFFLAGLAGEDEALVPEPCPAAGKSSRFWKWSKKSGQHTPSWPVAGCVIGPQRAVAWRVLDAQFFGLAQRRKRVFVVASARSGFDPAAVLLEFEGVRRDSAPRRGQGENTADTLSARTDGGGFPGTDEACSGYVQPVVSTLDANYGRLQGCAGQDANHGHSHLVPIAFDSRQECVSSTEVFGSLSSSSPQAQAVSYAIQAGALRENPSSGPDGVGVQPHIAYTLEARAEVQAVGPIGMAVRRLTPRECERLQGFQWRCAPDYPGAWQDAAGVWWSPDYTAIPHQDFKGRRQGSIRMMADAPRYKALGNSWAIPCVRWIGRRIDAQLRKAS